MKKYLQTIAKWGKPTGVLMIIAGGLFALFGLPLYVIGSVPGILLIVSGTFLFKSADAAAKIREKPAAEMSEAFLEHYAKFLKWQLFHLIAAIVIILLIIFAFLILVVMGVMTELHFRTQL